MPQPSTSLQPVCCWNRCCTSTGSGAPPDAQNLSDDRSYLAMSLWLMIAVYMVGTPGKMVGFFLSRSRITASSSKRACSTISAPDPTPSSMLTVSA